MNPFPTHTHIYNNNFSLELCITVTIWITNVWIIHDLQTWRSVLVPCVESQWEAGPGPGWQGEGGIWGPGEAGCPSEPSSTGVEERKGALVLYGGQLWPPCPHCLLAPHPVTAATPWHTYVLNQLETEFYVISLLYLQSKQEHLMAWPPNDSGTASDRL